VIYLPYAQNPANETAIVVRTKGDPHLATDLLRAFVRQADPAKTVFNMQSLNTLVSNSLASRQLIVWLLTIFGAVALLLAIIGLYGLLSLAALQRTMEIGVRMALGAQRSQIVSVMLREALVLVSIGLAVGTCLALVGAKDSQAFLRCDGNGNGRVSRNFGSGSAGNSISCSTASRRPRCLHRTDSGPAKRLEHSHFRPTVKVRMLL
jgi:hypothetical protein